MESLIQRAVKHQAVLILQCRQTALLFRFELVEFYFKDCPFDLERSINIVKDFQLGIFFGEIFELSYFFATH